jgi:GNAT superfamily N-acetyltransferase
MIGLMAGVGAATIRPWASRDRQHVEALLQLLARDASVTSDEAPTYVAEADGRVVGTVTLCVYTTLTGPKAYLDHLVVAPEWRRRGIGRALMEYAIEQGARRRRVAHRLDGERDEAGWPFPLSITRLSRA